VGGLPRLLVAAASHEGGRRQECRRHQGRDGTTPAGSWDSGAGEGVWCHELKLPWILVRGDGPPHGTGERVTAVHILKMHGGDLTLDALGWAGEDHLHSKP